eukprot:TRINITY_DN57497_c0_g1_i1.p1 TRINITY_DN57497_c0_g1~~TRINITY_DN57497_c0_g1_i1.p1  ORF type:complete len:356 (-),score=57.73 TRINITY_DN57497_c0_g1_i1:39-1106(-)
MTMPPPVPLRRGCRWKPGYLFLLLMLAVGVVMNCSSKAFAGQGCWKRHELSRIPLRFFTFTERKEAPKNWLVSKRTLNRTYPKKKERRVDPRPLVLKFVNATMGLELSPSDAVYTTKKCNSLYGCTLKLSLTDDADIEEPLVFEGAGLTEGQAEESAAFMALHDLESSSIRRAAERRADRIKQLATQATEALEQLGSDSQSADVEVGPVGKESAFFLRALADVQGLASAHLVIDEDGDFAAIRISRSDHEPSISDEITTVLRIDGRGSEFWKGLGEKTRQQLRTAGEGTVQLLLDGTMGSNKAEVDSMHKFVIMFIRNIQKDVIKESPDARVHFLPRKLDTEDDASSMSVSLWLA